MYDYYKMLNLEKNFDKINLKHLYRDLCKSFHPDLNAKHNDGRIMKMLNEAYSVMSDDEKRKEYDKCNLRRLQDDFPSLADRIALRLVPPTEDVYFKNLLQIV